MYTYKDYVELELDLKPLSENTAYPRGKQGQRYLTEEGKSFKEVIAGEMTKELVDNCDLPEGFLEGKWEVHLWLGFKDNRTRDLPNYEKLIFDALTGILWEDDDWTHIPKHTTAYEPCDKNYIRLKCFLL